MRHPVRRITTTFSRVRVCGTSKRRKRKNPPSSRTKFDNNSTFVEDEKEEDENEFYIRERKEALGKELRHRYEASLPIEMRKDFKSIQSAYVVVFKREAREYHLYHSQLFIHSDTES